MPTLLVVDDEQSICWGLTRLGEDMGHRVWTASSAEQALEIAAHERPDVIVLDVRLPGIDGLQALEQLRQHYSDVPVIVITAYGDLRTAVSAVRCGAFEYIVKPFDLEKMQTVLHRALASRQSQEDLPSLEHVGGLIGRSVIMQEVFKRIALAAASDINVLLQGESGTGKELAARAIHQYSRRCDAPFIAVNVAALSPSLAESELFGHVRGSFTGAVCNRPGLLLQANGGTLFLDEVADIPLSTQVKLLRALEHNEVCPVGSSKPERTDFRVIAASHQDLLSKVQDGSFRQDLYFRLCAFEIEMPALRSHPEDIPLLAEHIRSITDEDRSAPKRFSQRAIQELCQREWQGNVRQLRNAVEHAMTLARGGMIEPEHLPVPPPPIIPSAASDASVEPAIAELVARWTAMKLAGKEESNNLYQQLLQLIERPLLFTTLSKHRHQCATAARTLGMHRTTLRKKLDEHGIVGQ